MQAFDERLRHAIFTQRDKLGQLMGKINQMRQLMDDSDDNNLQVVQTLLIVEFNKLFERSR